MILSLLLSCAFILLRFPQVFQTQPLPPTGTTADTTAKLPFVMRNTSDLTEVARTTRTLLRDGFMSRFTSRVWDSTARDPSFFRDAAVVLVPPYAPAKHLDMLKLTEGDKDRLPQAKKALAPTSDDDVESARELVWNEIRTRAINATLAEGASIEDMAAAREKKRQRVSATAGASSGDSAWAMFEDARVDSDSDDDSPEAANARRVADAGKAVDDEIARFKAVKIAGKMPPRNALVF